MTPDFRELVGDDLPEEERARLEHVHDLLVAAGPPPELPPGIAELESEPENVVALPRRRAGALLAIAAAIALVAVVGGYVAGRRGNDRFSTVKSVPMHGTAIAQTASATIDLGDVDQSGNWPLRVEVRNLPKLPRGAYYEMYLTKHGKPVATCGTFVTSGTTTVRLNAPYSLRRYDGWVVTRNLPGSHRNPVVLTT
ncbi:MAG TPA: anti-sigma factor [Gaiellaceae bacterium]|nr:anti-sigma factor [Gaiellaceae bacterium]